MQGCKATHIYACSFLVVEVWSLNVTFPRYVTLCYQKLPNLTLTAYDFDKNLNTFLYYDFANHLLLLAARLQHTMKVVLNGSFGNKRLSIHNFFKPQLLT